MADESLKFFLYLDIEIDYGEKGNIDTEGEANDIFNGLVLF
jgi:hypothetical protein